MIRTVSHFRSWAGTDLGRSVCSVLGSPLGSNGKPKSNSRGYCVGPLVSAYGLRDIETDKGFGIPHLAASIPLPSFVRGYATWKESNATESEEDVRADQETEISSVKVLEKVTELKQEVPDGWSEENATESEADVKADRVQVDSVEALDAYTIEKLKVGSLGTLGTVF